MAGAAETPETALPVLRLDFEEAPALPATLSGPNFVTQFPAPDFTPGVRGQAWRSDGFSSSVRAPLDLSGSQGFTVSAWVALDSYPSSLERPVEGIVPASLLNQADAHAGFDLFLDTFGRWGFRVSTLSGARTLRAAEAFPLQRWVHLAASYAPADGAMVLYLDGRAVASLAPGRAAAFVPSPADFRVAESWQAAMMGIFRVNGLNAAFDEVAVHDRALSAADVVAIAASAMPPPAAASLGVPASRFAADLQRPVYHAMPPANWANEPHGLIRRGDAWHMFYQRTPNGPFKTQMVWGHMVSRDLVRWEDKPNALWPTLQTDDFGFDMKGIWSGDVVLGPDGRGWAFYTSVNHSAGFFNPGISVAVSSDADLLGWEKLGPVLDSTGLRDFRDPYVWEEGGAWHMLVGAAARPKGGGLAYYRCNDFAKVRCWKKQPRIAPFDAMDIGSDIWEMPVLEALGGGKHVLVVNPIGGAVTKYGPKATRAVYWVGTWADGRFRPDDSAPKMLDVLPGHLSPTVDRDAAGRLVGIGIVDERRSDAAQKAAGWAHTFSLPRVWRLLADGRTLGQSPWPGLSTLRAEGSDEALAWTGDRGLADRGRTYELDVRFEVVPDGKPYGVFLGASPDGREITRLTYDAQTGEFVLDKERSTLTADGEGPMLLRGAYDAAAFGPPRRFHIFVDHSVVDVFINDAAAFSVRIYPSGSGSSGFGLISGGPAKARVQAWTLRGR